MSYADQYRLPMLAILILIATSKSAPADNHGRLRVLSYNIHHGEGTDGKIDLPRIARVISSVKPDIVALQEVDRGVGRSQRVDQLAELARLTKLEPVFGGNLRFGGGDYGNALLTGFRVSKHKNHLLERVENGEQRGVLDVTLDVPNLSSPLRVLATHFDHRGNDAERQLSARAVNALITGSPEAPMLLAGDLNDRPSSPTLQILGKHWQSTSRRERPTIPVNKPQRQIDFILFRPLAAWELIEFTVLPESVASDHRPILAVLQWKGNSVSSRLQ